MEASLKVQQGMKTALEGLGYTVYDHRPAKEVPYPFIVIGDDNQSDLDVKNADYLNIMSTVLVFSTYKGKKQVKEIMEAVRQAGHNLQVTGFEVVGATVSNSFTMEDTDNQLTQGVVELDFKLIKGE